MLYPIFPKRMPSGMVLFVVVALLGLKSLAATQTSGFSYFCGSYVECRQEFRNSTQKLSVRQPSESGSWKVPSRIDSDLTLDWFYLPPSKEPKKLLILSSGVHGVEAFGGSAVQNYFFKKVLSRINTQHFGILIIHSVNPFGMKYFRRVSENNVDLNRNFDTSRKLFETTNESYGKLNAILNPQEPVSQNVFTKVGFYFSVGNQLLHQSLKVLRQAILGGQYHFHQGIYFGGREFEPQKDFIEKLVTEKAKPYREVLALDLHTGYGNRGVLHLLPNPYDTDQIMKNTEKVFRGFSIENPTGNEFYSSNGDFSTYLSRLLTSQGKLTVPMTLEFGTFPNTTTLGGVESLRRMIAENQMHWHGAVDEEVKNRVNDEFIELYFPSSEDWREAVLREAERVLPPVLDNFNRM